MEHLTEGTKEWDELARYLLASGNSDPAFDAVARNYFKGDETVGESALAKFQKGTAFSDLTEQEQLFLTELIAHETEVLFGSERMLKRIAKEKRSLAKRLLERIEDFFHILKMSKEERKAFVKLEQARACLEKALLAAGDAEGEKRKKDSISIDNYTEEQYNNFGWVRANDVISAGQYADFSTKFAGAVSGQLHFNKSKFDEYMIPVSDLYRRDLEGIENVIVFAKGEIECPYITRITEINSYNYKEIEEIQEVVYESGKRGIQITDSELLRLYYNPNAGSAENVAFGEGFDGNENSSGKRVGRRSGKTDKRVVGFRELEEGVTEYQYSDGTAEIISDKNIRKSKADADFEKRPIQKMERREYTLQETKSLFEKWNSDREVATLAEKVFEKLEIKMAQKPKGIKTKPFKIKFESEAYCKDNFPFYKMDGVYWYDAQSELYGITYNADRFEQMDDQTKAVTVLHEAIHACTILSLKETFSIMPPLYGDEVLKFVPNESWTEEQKACLSLIQIAHQIGQAESEKGYYGQRGVYEMVAELSNPEFRQFLKKQSLWERIVTSIKRLLGIDTYNAFDAASVALDKLLDSVGTEREPGKWFILDKDGNVQFNRGRGVRRSKADAEFESFSAEDFFHEAATRSVSEVVGESEKSTNAPEAPQVPKKRGLSEGQAKKLEANYVNHKTFSRKEVAEVVDSITRKHLDFGEDYGVLIGKGRQEAAKRFFA